MYRRVALRHADAGQTRDISTCSALPKGPFGGGGSGRVWSGAEESGADQGGIGAGRGPEGGGLIDRCSPIGRGRPVEEPGSDGIEDRPPVGSRVENGHADGASSGGSKRCDQDGLESLAR